MPRIDSKYQAFIRPFFKSYSEIFFIGDHRVGWPIFLLSFFHPNIGICGFISLTTIFLFNCLVRSKEDFMVEGHLLYNPLLVGLSIGWLFKINLTVIFLLVCSSLLTYFLTILLRSFFLSMKLPVLSIPYCLVSILFHLGSKNYSNLYFLTRSVPLFRHDLEGLLGERWKIFFKALGSIIYTPDVLVGIIIFLLIFLKSRVLVVFMFLGVLLGELIENNLSHHLWRNFNLTFAFNYILVSGGLCSVFFLPTLKSLLFIPLTVGTTVLLVDALNFLFSGLGIPIFTIPFNIISLIYLFSIKYLKIDIIPFVYGDSPEKTLDKNLAFRKRFPYFPTISLPFNEEWKVYQSFEDIWTHQGPWKYALDFIKTDSKDLSYRGRGLSKEDYYAFGADLLSPVSGIVVAVRLDLPDNEIGKVDVENNWGNHLIIKSDYAYHVVLAHLQQYSSPLKMGEYVYKGQFIGKCGNSGYSPQPHLHLQVQSSPILGDQTLNFNLDEYMENGTLKYLQIPAKDAIIAPSPSVKGLDVLFNYTLGQTLKYKVRHKDKESPLNVVVQFDKYSGRFFWQDQWGNRLYYTKTKDYFSFDYFEGNPGAYLSYFLVTIPKIPLFYRPGLSWSDYLPNGGNLSKFNEFIWTFRQILHFGEEKKSSMAKMRFGFNDINILSISWKNKRRIESKIRLSPGKDIEAIEMAELVIQRSEK